jgi:choline dehydrogenase-like flavoprotein
VIEDARSLPDGSVIHADICIVGAGAAGITIAREFAGSKTSVLLVESGAVEFEEPTQALYDGEVSPGLYDLNISRLRYFGGSTNHWGGVCRPLDADDFAVRPGVPYSGWPIALADLQAHYDRACDIVQLSSTRWDNETWRDRLARFYTLPFMGERIAGAVFQLSPPTRFGETYHADLATATNVRTLLHANVVDIETNEAASHVTALHLACLDGTRFTVHAEAFVLAVGAVEVARLLLVANRTQSVGLGNAHNLVGRFYCNHPGFYAADILLSQPADVMARPIAAMQTILPRLIVTPSEAARQKLPKFSTWAHPVGEDGSLDLSTGYVAMRALFRDLRHGHVSSDLLDKLGRILGDLDGVAHDVYARFRPAPMIRLDPEWEQVPNPDSRVTLIGERDALGMNRVRVDWQLTDLDIHTVSRSLEIIGEVVGEAGFGRIRVHEWLRTDPKPATFPGHENYHPAGTTRMSDDPTTGVVDRNCRLHSVDNLYVAGASVFATVGAVNPTLTVVALSLRLAEHLKTTIT